MGKTLLALAVFAALVAAALVAPPDPRRPPAAPSSSGAAPDVPAAEGARPRVPVHLPAGRGIFAPWSGDLGYGRVVDGDGNPVPDVTVIARPEPDFDPSGASRQTDANGRFRIRKEWVGQHLLAYREGVSTSDWLPLTEETREMVLTLGPGAVVTGRIRDPGSGMPVAGARVRLAFTHESFPKSWDTTSDEEGAYRFEGVPAGAFAWPRVEESERASPVQTFSSFDTPSRTELVAEGAARSMEGAGDVFRCDLDAIRWAGGRLRVRAVLPPEVSNAEHVDWEHVWAIETRSSRVSSRVAPQGGVVLLTRFLRAGTNRITFSIGRFVATTGDIAVTGDGDLGERTIEFSGRTRVVARLVDEAGEPLRRPGVRVKLAEYIEHKGGGFGSGIGRAETDEKGRADLTDLIPEEEALRKDGYTVRFTLEGEGLLEASPWGEHTNLVLPGKELARRMAEAATELLIDVPAADSVPLVIRVLDAEGRPVPDVALALSEGDFTEEAAVSGPDGLVTVGARFDPERWSWARVEAKLPWMGSIEHGEGTDVDLQVREARRVVLAVRDEEDRPVAGVGPGRSDGWRPIGSGPFARRVTGGDGTLPILVPEGDTSLSLRLADHFLFGRVRIPAGEPEVAVGVHRLVPVRVLVRAPEGLAAEQELRVGWKVRQDGEEAGGAEDVARSGEGSFEGEIRLPRLPRELRVLSPDLRWIAERTVGPEEEEVELVLERRKLHDVTVLLLDREGRPLADRTVLLRKFGRVGTEAFLPDETRSDGNGKVVFSLPEGTWGVHGLSTEDGYRSGRFEIRAPAGEPLEIVLSGP